MSSTPLAMSPATDLELLAIYLVISSVVGLLVITTADAEFGNGLVYAIFVILILFVVYPMQVDGPIIMPNAINMIYQRPAGRS